MGAMSPWHWAIVAIVVVILFGSKKLPDAARGLGRSLRIFKSEVKEMQNDDTGSASAQAAPNPLPAGRTGDTTAAEATHTEPRSA
ncbi:MAG: Sec-independent protein translocase subunit TatA [Rhodococcus sp. (in: high G+C Gram-positive bacteria)]|uniref:Sec-independent protein translocase subunit TatA n=1 Tax=Rhodococcus sp. TaxID=1831 RepID=UPI003BB68B61